MNNISVTPKGGTIASQLSGSDVNLNAPSVVKLNLNRSDIKSFARNGNDLVVTTKSGETVVIHNFYSRQAKATWCCRMTMARCGG
nr:BapA prefix-like domain-containing protein [Pantoea piersonii]